MSTILYLLGILLVVVGMMSLSFFIPVLKAEHKEEHFAMCSVGFFLALGLDRLATKSLHQAIALKLERRLGDQK